MLLVLGANLLWSSHLYAMLTQYKRTASEPHSQHVTIDLELQHDQPQQCSQTYDENIPILPLLFESPL
jgi:hypothetical protein